MNFVALLLGLGIERLLTHLFHLREFHWLDPLFDSLFRRISGASAVGAIIGVSVFALITTLPVALVSWILMNELLQIPYFLFAVFVLLFSLGPRDLKEEVNDYCAAVESGNAEKVREIARELLEADPPDGEAAQVDSVERAVFVQANNRIFGVALWFVLLGPTGAWWFRILDLMRHRLANHAGDDATQPGNETLVWAVRTVHGVFAWLPARMVAAGYALAGSFEGALSDWRTYYNDCAPNFFEINNDVLGCAGCGAVGTGRAADAQPSAANRIRAAWDLVFRTLWLIWCPVFAILTLYNWMV